MDSCLKYFIYSAGRCYGPENQPVPGETDTNTFSSPPPSTPKTGKKRRSSWSSSAAADSNLSPAVQRCHVLSVIRGDGLYTRPRRPGRARITTRAHKTHTHPHIYMSLSLSIYIYVCAPDVVRRLFGVLETFSTFSPFQSIVPLSRHPAVPSYLLPTQSSSPSRIPGKVTAGVLSPAGIRVCVSK